MSRACTEARSANAVGDGRAARAPGVGPAVDALLEEEPVEDELAAPVEQLDERPAPAGAFELVVALDPHHRHALPSGGELVQRSADGLLAFGQHRLGRVPFALADHRRAGEGHRLHPSAPPANACPVGRPSGHAPGGVITRSHAVPACLAPLPCQAPNPRAQPGKRCRSRHQVTRSLRGDQGSALPSDLRPQYPQRDSNPCYRLERAGA